MAHWAKISDENLVTQVVVTDNTLPDEGYQWLLETHGGRWVKTSYNTFQGVHKLGGNPLRKNYACIGYVYDEVRDAFYAPKPDPIITPLGFIFEYELDENTCTWVSTLPEEDPIPEEETPFS